MGLKNQVMESGLYKKTGMALIFLILLVCGFVAFALIRFELISRSFSQLLKGDITCVESVDVYEKDRKVLSLPGEIERGFLLGVATAKDFSTSDTWKTSGWIECRIKYTSGLSSVHYLETIESNASLLEFELSGPDNGFDLNYYKMILSGNSGEFVRNLVQQVEHQRDPSWNNAK